MAIDIDQLTESELIDLNHRIIAKVPLFIGSFVWWAVQGLNL